MDNATIEITRSGKSCAGGKLWHVKRNGIVLSTINEVTGCDLFAFHPNPSSRPEVFDTFKEAADAARKFWS